MLTNSARAPRRARTRASKFYNAPIRSKLILHTFQAILSILQNLRARNYARAFTRVSARPGIMQHRIAKFCSVIIFITFFQAFWYLVYLFPTSNNAISGCQSWTHAPTCAICIHNTWAKTCLYKIHFNSSEWIDTPKFLSYLNRLWVGDMISCLIWPSINSWRHHNGLRTLNFNLHIMTSVDF